MTHQTKPPLWIIVDGQNTVHRDAYGAGITRAAATLGKRLELMLEKWSPAAIVSCWDSGGPTFRHELFTGYKSGRKRLEGINQAIEDCQEECRSRGVAVMEAPGFEADDLIATLADQALADGCRVTIYSGDKDLYQLLRDGEVNQLISVRRQFGQLDCDWVTAKGLQEKHGVTPAQWVEFKMLCGDPSDKIDGVDNVGPKIAAQVLRDCGSLAEFYRSPFIAGVSPAKRAAIIAAKPRMQLLRSLCTLRHDVPLPELWREGV